MLREIGALAACVTVMAACHGAPRAPSTQPTTPDQPGRPDQATVFFPATVDTYGLDLGRTDREHLAELHALRQIDPCGFVDGQTLAAGGHHDFGYTYAAVEQVAGYGFGLVHPDGGDACTIALLPQHAGLSIQVLPGEPRATDDRFTADPPHPGITRSTVFGCIFRVTLPLTGLAGAPASMHDPVAEVRTRDVDGGTASVGDATLCGLAEAVANGIAERLGTKGIPVYANRADVAARFLTGDPCAAAAGLHAAGFTWREPPPQAQWPTTWRHLAVCRIALLPSDGDVGSAVVKYGLAAWSDKSASSPDGSVPTRTEQDGVTLLDFTSDQTYCSTFVIAKTNLTIQATMSGPGAPDMTAATPVVTVRLTAPHGADCAQTAKQAALDAVRRAR